MSCRVGFEGKALVQFNGLPPGAFDAMAGRVVDLVDAPWDADLMDALLIDPATCSTVSIAGTRPPAGT